MILPESGIKAAFKEAVLKTVVTDMCAYGHRVVALAPDYVPGSSTMVREWAKCPVCGTYNWRITQAWRRKLLYERV